MKTKIFQLLVFPFLMMLVNNCIQSTEPGANPVLTDTLILNDTISLNYKDVYGLPDNSFWIKFDSLISDSRCPIGVICVWAGNAEIQLETGTPLRREKIILNTHRDMVRDTTIFNRHVELVRVKPYPHIDSTYSASDYRITIKVD